MENIKTVMGQMQCELDEEKKARLDEIGAENKRVIDEIAEEHGPIYAVWMEDAAMALSLYTHACIMTNAAPTIDGFRYFFNILYGKGAGDVQ